MKKIIFSTVSIFVFVLNINAQNAILRNSTTGNSLTPGAVNSIITQTSSNNIGIGTTAPSEKLHIIGNVLASGTLTANGIIGNSSLVTNGFLWVTGNSVQVGNNLLIGNTIIGGTLSSTTTNKLEVQGSTLLSGNTTIGTTTANASLIINGDLFFNKALSNTRNIYGNATDAPLVINANTGSTNGPSIEMYGINNSSRPGKIHFSTYGVTGIGFEFNNYNPTLNSWKTNLSITKDGKVIIGNVTTPNNYKLYM